MRRRVGRAAVLAVALTAVVPSATPASSPGSLARAAPGDPQAHLAAILERSPAPEYRRFGSPGMAAAADYAAGALTAAGYPVLRHDRPAEGYRVDYAPDHAPLVERVVDGRTFPTESAFSLGATTPPGGLQCVVRRVADVGPGDCGFVPFHLVSPEWKNVLADVRGQVDQILARGGAGVILQGDLARGALIALRVRRPIPTVVALAAEGDVVGHEVRLRAEGGPAVATLRNVVAVRPPADPAAGYVLLQGHLDAWFAGAADNGGGAAAVLAAAERLAAGPAGRRGLVVALYDGEEWGLLGSKAFAADLADADGVGIGACGPTVRLDDIVAVVNLDASSAKPSDLTGPIEVLLGMPVPLFNWRVLVFSEEPTLATTFLAEMTAAGVLGAPMPVALADQINSGMSRTDGRWFHEAGIPVAWPVAGYAEYHTAADTPAAVDPADLEAVTSGAVSLVRALDAAPVGRIPGATLAAPGSTPPPPLPASCAGAGVVPDPSGTGGHPATPSAGSSAPDGVAALPATGGGVPSSWVGVAVAVGLVAALRAGRQAGRLSGHRGRPRATARR